MNSKNTLNITLKSILTIALLGSLTAGCGKKANEENANENTEQTQEAAQNNQGGDAVTELQIEGGAVIDSDGNVTVIDETTTSEGNQGSQGSSSQTGNGNSGSSSSGSGTSEGSGNNGSTGGSESAGSGSETSGGSESSGGSDEQSGQGSEIDVDDEGIEGTDGF